MHYTVFWFTHAITLSHCFLLVLQFLISKLFHLYFIKLSLNFQECCFSELYMRAHSFLKVLPKDHHSTPRPPPSALQFFNRVSRVWVILSDSFASISCCVKDRGHIPKVYMVHKHSHPPLSIIIFFHVTFVVAVIEAACVVIHIEWMGWNFTWFSFPGQTKNPAEVSVGQELR